MDPIELFYWIDEFCKEYQVSLFSTKLPGINPKNAGRKSLLALSEVMTIKIMYHHSGFKTFKGFYMKNYAELKSYFPKLISYTRIVELTETCAFPLLVLAKTLYKKDTQGVGFIDSTKLEVCHIKRASSHKVFAAIARKGKNSMGWFYGFKLHLIVNPFGEVVDFDITSGNVADNNESLICKLTRKIKGKLFGDRGYILNQELLAKLLEKGLFILSRARKNMKQRLIGSLDSALLQKRGVIDSVIGVLKQSLGLEHSRHRSLFAFLAHTASTLISYFFRPNKPSIMAYCQPFITQH